MKLVIKTIEVPTVLNENEIADKILTYGTNIENYPAGQIDDLFNAKKQACLKEVNKRKQLDSV